MTVDENQEPAQQSDQLEVLKINISYEVKTGKIEVSGHIDNTAMCTQVIIEAGHIIIKRNSDKIRLAILDQERILSAAKLNGQHENPTPPAAN